MLTFGTSRERGLKRVPRDGPPTWAMLAGAAVIYVSLLTRMTALVLWEPAPLALSLCGIWSDMVAMG